MYAIVTIKGKQYKAEQGKKLVVDLFNDVNIGDSLKFPAQLVSSSEGVKVGSPDVAGVTVTTKVADSFKGKKITIFKYLRRKGYRKTQGHRQNYTTLVVEKIG
jgi:large subunit ribosomal protein L21